MGFDGWRGCMLKLPRAHGFGEVTDSSRRNPPPLEASGGSLPALLHLQERGLLPWTSHLEPGHSEAPAGRQAISRAGLSVIYPNLRII